MVQGVVYQRADGTILSMNPAAMRILGKHPEEFIGKTSEAVEHHTLRPDGSIFPGSEHPSMVALRTGRTIRGVEMGVFNPWDHRYRWINIVAVPIFKNHDPQPHQVYTIFDDITERRANERARELSDQRFRVAIASAELGTWTVDVLAGTAEMDERTRALFGHPDRPRLLVQDAFERIHPEDREATQRRMAAALEPASDGHFEAEYRVLGRGTQSRWVRATGQTLFEGTGERRRATQFVGVVMDVTERRLREQGLFEDMERFRAMAQTIPQIVWTTNPAGEIAFLNDRWTEYTGQTIQEGLSWGWLSAMHPEEMERIETAWKKALATQSPYELEYRMRQGNGHYRWFVARGLTQLTSERVKKFLSGVRIDPSISLATFGCSQRPAPNPLNAMDSRYLWPYFLPNAVIIGGSSDGMVGLASVYGDSIEILTRSGGRLSIQAMRDITCGLDHAQQFMDYRFFPLFGRTNVGFIDREQNRFYTAVIEASVKRMH